MQKNKIGNIVLATIITLNMTGCSLQKESLTGDVVRGKITFSNENVNKYSDEMNNFINNIESKIPELNTDNFYKNIKTLKIISNANRDKLKFSYYDIDTNTIEITDYGLEHELTHLLFANLKNDKRGIIINEKNRGRALDEGFVELISSEVMDIENAYNFEVGLARILITIVGKDKIIEILNKQDLKLLYTQLSNIKPSVEDAEDFVEYTDAYNFLLNKMHDEFFKKGTIDEFKKTEDFNKLKDIKRVIIGRIKIYIKSYFKQHLNDDDYKKLIMDMLNTLDIVNNDLFNSDLDEQKEKDFFLRDEINYLINNYKIPNSVYDDLYAKSKDRKYFVNNYKQTKSKSTK